MSDREGLSATVEGRVQGVGFRYFTQKAAVSLNLVGWVRNTYQGTVELYAEGDKSNLTEFINLLHQEPPSSVVTNIKMDWEKAKGCLTSFRVKLTR